MPYTHAMTILASTEVDFGSVMNNPMAISERLALSGQMIILGLVTVFSVLALIWGILTLFRVFMYDIPNKRKAPSKQAEAPIEQAPAEEVPVSLPDDTELIAVLSAAIAAAEQQPVSSLRVVSFRRSGAPRWNER